MKEYLESPLKDKITPEKLYFSRRKFLRLSATIGVTAALAACGVTSSENPTPGNEGTPTATETPLPDVETPYDTIIHYNNFYEFSTDKGAVANMVSEFQTEPWTVEIGGLVNNPVTLTANEIIQKYPASEHVYRMRCVEGWSMVVPWNGFSLNRLLADVGVQPAAKFIAFTTVLRPSQMPGQNDAFFTWPYEEGIAAGRSHARPDPAGQRIVRQTAPQTGWGAVEDRGALEIRIQKHQIHSQDRGSRRSTQDLLEYHCPQ